MYYQPAHRPHHVHPHPGYRSSYITTGIFTSAPVIPIPTSFPLPLLSVIFAHLPDMPSLLACTRVCRAWCFVIQPHLMRSITIRSEKSLFQLWERLFRYPYLASYVRELSVNALESYKVVKRAWHLAQEASSYPDPSASLTACTWVLAVPPLLARMLTRLEVLRFEYLDSEALPEQFHNRECLGAFVPLREVSLSLCRMRSFEEFEWIVNCFAGVQTLSLNSTSLSSDSEWGAAEPSVDVYRRTSDIAPTTLKVGRLCDPKVIQRLIYSSACLQTVRRLEYHSMDAGNAAIVGNIFLDLSPNLEYLRFGCTFEGRPDASEAFVNNYLDLRRYRNLHTLHLSLFNLQDSSLTWVHYLLSQALPSYSTYPKLYQTQATPVATPTPHGYASSLPPSMPTNFPSTSFSAVSYGSITTTPQISKVVFDIWLSDPSQLEVPAWRGLVEILWRLTAAGAGEYGYGVGGIGPVKQVEFIQRGDMSFAEADKIIRQKMAVLGKGVVLVSSGEDW